MKIFKEHTSTVGPLDSLLYQQPHSRLSFNALYLYLIAKANLLNFKLLFTVFKCLSTKSNTKALVQNARSQSTRVFRQNFKPVRLTKLFPLFRFINSSLKKHRSSTPLTKSISRPCTLHLVTPLWAYTHCLQQKRWDRIGALPSPQYNKLAKYTFEARPLVTLLRLSNLSTMLFKRTFGRLRPAQSSKVINFLSYVRFLNSTSNQNLSFTKHKLGYISFIPRIKRLKFRFLRMRYYNYMSNKEDRYMSQKRFTSLNAPFKISKHHHMGVYKALKQLKTSFKRSYRRIIKNKHSDKMVPGLNPYARSRRRIKRQYSKIQQVSYPIKRIYPLKDLLLPSDLSMLRASLVTKSSIISSLPQLSLGRPLVLLSNSPTSSQYCKNFQKVSSMWHKKVGHTERGILNFTLRATRNNTKSYLVHRSVTKLLGLYRQSYSPLRLSRKRKLVCQTYRFKRSLATSMRALFRGSKALNSSINSTSKRSRQPLKRGRQRGRRRWFIRKLLKSLFSPLKWRKTYSTVAIKPLWYAFIVNFIHLYSLRNKYKKRKNWKLVTKRRSPIKTLRSPFTSTKVWGISGKFYRTSKSSQFRQLIRRSVKKSAMFDFFHTDLPYAQNRYCQTFLNKSLISSTSVSVLPSLYKSKLRLITGYKLPLSRSVFKVSHKHSLRAISPLTYSRPQNTKLRNLYSPLIWYHENYFRLSKLLLAFPLPALKYRTLATRRFTPHTQNHLWPSYSTTFYRSVFFFVTLFNSFHPYQRDIANLKLYSPLLHGSLVFPNANNIKVKIFRRINRSKQLFQKRFETFHTLTSTKRSPFNFFKSPFYKNLSTKAPETSLLKYVFGNSRYWSHLRGLKHVVPMSEYSVRIRRIRFKPGYGRIWREARISVREILNITSRYQYRLTPKLQKRYYELRKANRTSISLTIGFILLTSRLAMDSWTLNSLMFGGNIFLNGGVCLSSKTLLFATDFIQLIVNIKFYLALKWMRFWSVNRYNRTSKIFYRKYKPLHTNRFIRSVRRLPTWFFDLQTTYVDVLKIVELDYFTLSIFLLHDYTDRFGWVPRLVRTLEPTTINMYNWKYIT